MVDLTEISAIVAAAGVVVGVAYYVMEMRNQTRLKQTDILLRLYSTFGSPEYKKALTQAIGMEFRD